MKAEICKAVAGALVVTMTSSSLTPAAWAGSIGTESALGSDRERILVVLDRAEVRSALEARGVTGQDAKARVAALTDTEAAALAQQIDSAPAGGFIQVLVFAVYVVAYVIAGFVSLVAKAAGGR